MTGMIWTAAATLALVGAAATGAASANQQPAPADAAAPQQDAAPEGPSNTARLNAEQAARAKAENTAYEQQVQAVTEEEAAAKQAFAEATASYEAEKARLAAMSAEERMQYEADVAACKAGDHSRCAKPAASKPPQH